MLPEFTQLKKSQIKQPRPTVSKPINFNVHNFESKYYRVDVEFYGVQHNGPSYEGRVFLNHENANIETPRDLDNRYAGSFYIFGHGGCFGDVGHCSVPTKKRPFDLRRSHPLVPIVTRVNVTKLVDKLQSDHYQVTLVPVIKATTSLCSTDEVINFKKIKLVAYQ